MIRRRGGNCPNTLEVLQQLLDCRETVSVLLALCAVLPSASSTGTQKVKSSLGPKVDLTRCIYREECDEAASCYILRSCSTDTRTIVNYNELPEMTSREFIAKVDELKHEMSWCHFEASAIYPHLHCYDTTSLTTARDEYQMLRWIACSIFVGVFLQLRSASK